VLPTDFSTEAFEVVLRQWAEIGRSAADVLEALTPRHVDMPAPESVLQKRRNAEARHGFLEEFGALTSAGVATLADSRATNRAALANRWRRQGRIFAMSWRDQLLYPAFQFDTEGQPLPVIADVIGELDPNLSPWELALWFAAPNGRLGGKRPVDLLHDEPESIRDAAVREVTELVT
jgi:hypothetical protein